MDTCAPSWAYPFFLRRRVLEGGPHEHLSVSRLEATRLRHCLEHFQRERRSVLLVRGKAKYGSGAVRLLALAWSARFCAQTLCPLLPEGRRDETLSVCKFQGGQDWRVVEGQMLLMTAWRQTTARGARAVPRRGRGIMCDVRKHTIIHD